MELRLAHSVNPVGDVSAIIDKGMGAELVDVMVEVL